ncbi:hypothetical protein GCM10009639_12180 [Kitasatospora putterlickiae]|uniref:Uncharacterized protein n=1 Tax=Kitasatospora putterlickiae TaxID=221725 RepID=A0ABN1XPZ1_9ACTN
MYIDGEPAIWAALGRVAAGYRADGTPHLVLRDGQVLVIDGQDGWVL